MRIQKQSRNLCLLGAFALSTAGVLAGTAKYTFDKDPFDTGDNTIRYYGNNADGRYVNTGGNPGGYVSLTQSVNSQSSVMIFPDIDNGDVVEAFSFTADVRIGNAVGNSGRAADGFSISYARVGDPVLDDGNGFPVAHENGTATGIAIGFDTWSGNALPDGPDIEGLIIRLDNRTILKEPLPTRNGACNDTTSIQTGPYNPDTEGAPDGLCWAKVEVTMTKDAKLTVKYKGKTFLDNVATEYFPSPGQLVLAARTGGANENHQVDNIEIKTEAVKKGAPPAAPGTLTVAEAGARRVLLTWAASADAAKPGARVAYTVYRDGQPLTATRDGQVLATTRDTRFEDRAVQPGKAYKYSIRTIDVSLQTSSASNEVTANTGAETETKCFLPAAYFTGVGGVNIDAMTGLENYPNSPNEVRYLNTFFFSGYGDNYGARISGFFTPATGGDYVFFVAGDDNCQLFLSTDANPANKKLIAIEPQWNGDRAWATADRRNPDARENRSDQYDSTEWPTGGKITLVAGRKYYIEALMKEGGGGDSLGVYVKKADEADPADGAPAAGGPEFSGLVDGIGSSVTITEQPKNTVVVEGRKAVLSVKTTVKSPYISDACYQWYRDGSPIRGANSASYTTAALAVGGGGKYKVDVTVPGTTLTSSEVTVSVIADTFAPVPSAGAIAKGGKQEIGVGFDEAVNNADLVAGNFEVVSGGKLDKFEVVSRPLTGFSDDLPANQKPQDIRAAKLTVSGVTGDVVVRVKNVRDGKNNAIPAAGVTVTVKPEAAMTWDVVGSNEYGFQNNVARVSEQDFVVVSGGSAFWADYDEATFAYHEVEGDFDASVQLEYQDPSSQWARTGLYAREGGDFGKGRPTREGCEAAVNADGSDCVPKAQRFSRLQGVHANPTIRFDNGVANNSFENHYRNDEQYTGGFGNQLNSTDGGFGPMEYPDNVWMRLTRTGNAFTTYRSKDGVNWTPMTQNRNFANAAKKWFVGLHMAPELGNNSARDGLGHEVLARYRNYKLSVGGKQIIPAAATGGSVSNLKAARGANGKVKITFDGGGVIQSSDKVDGTYSDTAIKSGDEVDASGSARYYRGKK